ncbi:C-type lectin lectoxin-Lio3-like [Glandiceps talaboti]
MTLYCDPTYSVTGTESAVCNNGEWTDNFGSCVPDPVLTLSCPDAWEEYGNSCYKIGMDGANWETARQTCVGLGADLATDKDVNTHDFIKGMVENMRTAGCNPKYHCNIWFGLYYSLSTGDKWVDDTSLGGFRPWDEGEPNSNSYIDSCTEFAISTDGVMWNDHDCSKHRRYICEKILSE